MKTRHSAGQCDDQDGFGAVTEPERQAGPVPPASRKAMRRRENCESSVRIFITHPRRRGNRPAKPGEAGHWSPLVDSTKTKKTVPTIDRVFDELTADLLGLDAVLTAAFLAETDND